MVKVKETNYIDENGFANVDIWLDEIVLANKHFNQENIKKACLFVAKLDGNNVNAENSCLRLGLQIAEIATDLNLDEASIIASILYRAVRENKITITQIEQEFSLEIANLIVGILKMSAISNKSENISNKNQIENIRKMLVAIIDDLRVALIKIAERTCAMRSLKLADEKRQKRVASEVANIYAPLAHRFGIGQIKWELEDLAFQFSEPEIYKKIAILLDEKRLDREKYLTNIIETIKAECKEVGIEAEVYGRVKHIYSIYRKMQSKQKEFEQIYDTRAIRVVVNTKAECYAVLGIVHSLWKHIPKEFDDYIANPKANGYKSLHTIVVGPNAKVFEVQIRTEQMHNEAELGVCAHSLYKGIDNKVSHADSYENKIAWMREILERHQSDHFSLNDYFQNNNDTHKRVYVFTPKGDTKDLEYGSTPLDFAYYVHSEVGHRCVGAKINGKIVPLSYTLQMGDQVEIITNKNSSPSRDWLIADLGFVKTANARSKIANFFRSQNKDENIEIGKIAIEKELQRLDLTHIKIEYILEKLPFQELEELYLACGVGNITINRIANVAMQIDDSNKPETIPVKEISSNKHLKNEISVEGVNNLKTSIATCCSPVPGDDILGFITKEKGISIHRTDCSNLLNLMASDEKRIINANWQTNKAFYEANILISAYNRSGLLNDIAQTMHKNQVSVLSVHSDVEEDGLVQMNIKIEVSSLMQLSKLLGKLRQVNNVIDAIRRKS